MDAVDAVSVAGDLLDRLAPQVPDVVHQPCVRARLVDELRRLVERAHGRPELGELALNRLERDADAARAALVGDRANAFEDRVAVVAGAGEEEDAGGLERCEPADPRANRLDALAWIVGAFHERQRQDRGHRGHGGRRLEPARVEALKRIVRQLHLPDPDAVGAGRAVRVEVVCERLGHRRDLRDRDARHRPKRSLTRVSALAGSGGWRSSCATSVPEPAPSPGPGCVLAPMW